MRSNQLKWLYIVGFVLVVGLVIGGGFWWMNWGGELEVVSGDGAKVVDETDITDGEDINTSDWKTYRNEEYGFSFDYPVKRVVETGENPSQPDLFVRTPDDRDDQIQIYIFDYKLLSQILNDIEKTSNISPYYYEDIGSYRVLVRKNILSEGPIMDSYFIIFKKIVLEVSFLKSEENINLVDNIINSLEEFKN